MLLGPVKFNIVHVTDYNKKLIPFIFLLFASDRQHFWLESQWKYLQYQFKNKTCTVWYDLIIISLTYQS